MVIYNGDVYTVNFVIDNAKYAIKRMEDDPFIVSSNELRILKRQNEKKIEVGERQVHTNNVMSRREKKGSVRKKIGKEKDN